MVEAFASKLSVGCAKKSTKNADILGALALHSLLIVHVPPRVARASHH